MLFILQNPCEHLQEYCYQDWTGELYMESSALDLMPIKHLVIFKDYTEIDFPFACFFKKAYKFKVKSWNISHIYYIKQ